MLRMMLRMPLGGLELSSIECDELGRDSSSIMASFSEKRLAAERCEEGLGGTKPSNEMNEPPPTWVGASVRIIKSLRLGAGLQGLVGGSTA